MHVYKQVVFIVPLHFVLKKFRYMFFFLLTKYLTNNKTYSFTIVYRSNKTTHTKKNNYNKQLKTRKRNLDRFLVPLQDASIHVSKIIIK